ncbi:ACT domain-containing protein [bacterium]|nr:ACT domain-containing protein [bacterium]
MDIAFDDQPSNSLRNLEYAFDKATLVPIDQTRTQFYIRLLASDTTGALAKIAAVLGKNSIGISKIIQKDIIEGAAEIVIITHIVLEKDMSTALESLQKERVVREILAKIRVGLDER